MYLTTKEKIEETRLVIHLVQSLTQLQLPHGAMHQELANLFKISQEFIDTYLCKHFLGELAEIGIEHP